MKVSDVSRANELYRELSKVFIDNGLASRNFSKLEEIYGIASDIEKLQPEWRKLNTKTIKQLQKENELLTMCQCGEFDIEFNRHCNSCVKDRIEKHRT